MFEAELDPRILSVLSAETGLEALAVVLSKAGLPVRVVAAGWILRRLRSRISECRRLFWARRTRDSVLDRSKVVGRPLERRAPFAASERQSDPPALNRL